MQTNHKMEAMTKENYCVLCREKRAGFFDTNGQFKSDCFHNLCMACYGKELDRMYSRWLKKEEG